MLQLTIEPFLIPRFYDLLEEAGVRSIAPRSDYEAFRGRFGNGWVVITVRGEINHNNDEQIKNMINRIYTLIIVNEKQDVDSRYMIVARHSVPTNDYPVNLLNLWLNPDQIKVAVELLENEGAVLTNTSYKFEDYCYELDGYRISFHDNGKVIAEEGYSVFAPILMKAIELYQPFSEYDLIIGQDEVGTGERIGPVVIGSVAANPQQLNDLQFSGVKDSKMMPRKLSGIMSRWIRDLSSVVSTYQLEPAEFNRLILGEQLSIPELVSYCHNQATLIMLERLQQSNFSLDNAIYIIDQYDKYRTIDALEDKKLNITVAYLPTAELHSPSVAAASVVAKAERYRWIQLHEKVYNIILKRKKIKQIRRHSKAHELLKVI